MTSARQIALEMMHQKPDRVQSNDWVTVEITHHDFVGEQVCIKTKNGQQIYLDGSDLYFAFKVWRGDKDLSVDFHE